jgi:serine/threonine protein kinase/Tfp pilus assembly protein PilF
MKCVLCHFENPEAAAFCSKCGAALTPTATGEYPATEAYRSDALDFQPGTIIDGKYKLLQELGSGGMGVVYLAEQTEPISRRVAVKIIKLGMDTRQVVARFEAERQALAVMDHPNIAKVFDAGATATGRPYFVMELISGIPMTAYCDNHRLSMRERLELFIPVCQAVQHAHQKGIIHRDLKPSNVLVTIQEGQAVPKIIDFGIARATDHHLAQRTIFTEQGQMIGTPEYMSPEQAEMSGLDIDTRTDIYSLGVTLYELLIGVLPFEPRELRMAGFAEIQRIIREAEPPKASTKLGALKATQVEVARKRKTDPGTLLRELRGDLDWITMKAMEKDRTRRYESASGLAADIRHYLSNEPVSARPPSAVYKIVKFAKRHKVGLGAGVFAATALVVGLILATTGMIRARRAEAVATRERDRANQEAQTSGQVSDFLVRMFEVSDPSEALGNKITAREILDQGAGKIQGELKDQPLIQARLMNTMGRVYQSLGLYGAATPLLSDALKIRRDRLGPEHADLAESLDSLAVLHYYKGEYKEAEPLYREALAMNRKLLGDEHPKVAEILNNLGLLMEAMGKFDESESLLRQALDMRRKLLGPEDPDLLQSLNNLGLLLDSRRKFDEAEPLLREALTLRRKVLGNEHPSVANTLNNLASVLSNKGNLAEAEAMFRETLAIRRKILGEEHPQVAQSLNNLSGLLRRKRDFKEAESLLREAIAINRKLLGNDHPEVANFIFNMGHLFAAQKDYGQADRYFREALAIRRRVLPVDHWSTVAAEFQVGSNLIRMERYAEAEPYLMDCYRVNKVQFGLEHAYTQATLTRIVDMYDDWKKPRKAAEYRTLLKKTDPPN